MSNHLQCDKKMRFKMQPVIFYMPVCIGIKFDLLKEECVQIEGVGK
jgi:hypothetical protein